jgi:uncharacterized membrane protein
LLQAVSLFPSVFFFALLLLCGCFTFGVFVGWFGWWFIAPIILTFVSFVGLLCTPCTI